MFAFENVGQNFVPVTYSVSNLTEKIVDFFHQQGKNNIEVKYIGDYRWKVEYRRAIEPCYLNDYADTKYEGYEMKLYKKNAYKEIIKETVNNYVELHQGTPDIRLDLFRDKRCSTDDENDTATYSKSKMFKHIWMNQKYGFENDGYIMFKSCVMICNSQYSYFESQMDNYEANDEVYVNL
jgi:hypothetical protein